MNKKFCPGRRSWFKLAISLLACISLETFAQFNGSLDLSGRTKPFQYNGILTGAYDGLLWGSVDKTKGTYGFYRVGARLGGSPTAAAFLQVAPIAPVVFEIQKSTTSRFLKTDLVDCGSYECLRKVDRLNYSVKVGGAFNRFFVMSKFMLSDVQPDGSNKPFYLEYESFIVQPGHYCRYFENTTVVGYKIDELQAAGLLYQGGELTGSSAHFYFGYGIYMRKLDWADLTAGLGYTENSGVPAAARDKFQGVSVLLSLSRSFGDTLSLF